MPPQAFYSLADFFIFFLGYLEVSAPDNIDCLKRVVSKLVSVSLTEVKLTSLLASSSPDSSPEEFLELPLDDGYSSLGLWLLQGLLSFLYSPLDYPSKFNSVFLLIKFFGMYLIHFHKLFLCLWKGSQ